MIAHHQHQRLIYAIPTDVARNMVRVSVRWSWPWFLQKWLNRARCRLGCRLKLAQGTVYYRHHLAKTIDRSVLGADASSCYTNTVATYLHLFFPHSVLVLLFLLTYAKHNCHHHHLL